MRGEEEEDKELIHKHDETKTVKSQHERNEKVHNYANTAVIAVLGVE